MLERKRQRTPRARRATARSPTQQALGNLQLLDALALQRTASAVVFSQWEPTGMGRGILLWLLGVPIPVILILALIWH